MNTNEHLETMDQDTKPLGQHIREVAKQKKISATKLAAAIPCERTNIYNVFGRDSINTRLLHRICEVLEYDFFKELSDSLSVNKCKNMGGGKISELTQHLGKRPHHEIAL